MSFRLIIKILGYSCLIALIFTLLSIFITQKHKYTSILIDITSILLTFYLLGMIVDVFITLIKK